MRALPGSDKVRKRLALEQLASAMEGPRRNRGEGLFWFIVAVIAIAGVVAYTAWVLNSSGPATGVL